MPGRGLEKIWKSGRDFVEHLGRDARRKRRFSKRVEFTFFFFKFARSHTVDLTMTFGFLRTQATLENF